MKYDNSLDLHRARCVWKQPALTPEEWEERLHPDNAEWAPRVFNEHSVHGSAASNLYGQPFGFTWSDVLHLHRLIDHVIPKDQGLRSSGLVEHTRSIADRLAALLPPRDIIETKGARIDAASIS